MKKIILFLAFFSILGCEKDDICDSETPTTPSLVVEFYDISNPTVLKNVVNLKITAAGLSEPLGVFNSVNKIKLPLKTNATTTNYSFVLNSSDLDNDNEDLISINYIGQDIFVSRACGYKTIYSLTETNPVIYSEPTTPDGAWIQDLQITSTSIINEKETHVKIFF